MNLTTVPDNQVWHGLHLVACDGSIKTDKKTDKKRYAIGLTAFHAKKVEYIKQEIWARMVLYNFCELITASVIIEQKPGRKYTYQLNYTRAIGICHYFIRLKEEKAPPDVEKLISHELLPIRTGRCDPRKVRPKSAISFLYRVA